MKNSRLTWTLLATAIAFSACGGLGPEDPGHISDTSTGGSTSATSSGGTGGITIVLPTSTSGPMDGGLAAGGGAAIGVPPGGSSSFPPMIVDGTGTPTIDGTGTSATTKTVTTTTAIDAQPVLAAGELTAGTWDDNLNFSFYSTYLSTTAATQLPGMPVIERSNRMVILVKDAAGQPVAGAQVNVTDALGHTWGSITGGEGRVIYFPEWASVAPGSVVSVTASAAGASAIATSTATAGTVELAFAEGSFPTVGALDLAFVIDTTGSMSDELSYVQRELDNIVGGIATQFPGIVQRFGLVAYRDEGDAYVVLPFDFTSDLSTFRANLAARSADGGNDYPEAVDQALAAATQLSWSPGATARVAFWIADAPHHVGKQDAVISALGAAVGKAVHFYPVAASGIDDLGEFTMRTAAEVTGGRYLFLTNDSGIGGSHAEPHIPCYYVTALTSAMRRMVASEVTGVYTPPAVSDILRTGGDPQNQQCTLSTGDPVTAW